MRAVARSTRSSASARRPRPALSACSRQRSTASASGPASSTRSSCSTEGAVSRSRTRRSGAPRARDWTRSRRRRSSWPSPRTRSRFARRGTRARTSALARRPAGGVFIQLREEPNAQAARRFPARPAHLRLPRLGDGRMLRPPQRGHPLSHVRARVLRVRKLRTARLVEHAPTGAARARRPPHCGPMSSRAERRGAARGPQRATRGRRRRASHDRSGSAGNTTPKRSIRPGTLVGSISIA